MDLNVCERAADEAEGRGGVEAIRPVVPQRPARKSAVQIRLPVDEDWAAIRELVRKHHARTIFAHIPFSDAKYEMLEKEARQQAPHQCLIVAELRGQIVGMAWFSAGEYVLGEGGIMTTAHLIAVDAEYCRPYTSARTFLRLVQGIKIWSISKESLFMIIHVSTGNSLISTNRLIKKHGSISIGGSHLIQVK